MKARCKNTRNKTDSQMQSENIHIQTNQDNDSLLPTETEEYANFGISSCCNTTRESMNLIMHLKVHSKPKTRQHSTDEISGLENHPPSLGAGTNGLSHRDKETRVPDPSNGVSAQQTPYSELLTYSPTVGDDPVAYEKTGTDSAPFSFQSSSAPSHEKTTSDLKTKQKKSHENSFDSTTQSSFSDSEKVTAYTSEENETNDDERCNVPLHAQCVVDTNGIRQSVGSDQPAASYGAFPLHPPVGSTDRFLGNRSVCHVDHSNGSGATAVSCNHNAGEDDGQDSWSLENNNCKTGGSNKRCVDPLTADTCCWWCTLSFNWKAYSLPLQHRGSMNIYSTMGIFCSPECCAAYVFDNAGKFGDSWKQYEMLHRIVHKIVDNKRVRIKLAPPRETLKKYGGAYSEKDYRKLISNYRTDVRLVMPPVHPVQTIIEETPADYNKPIKKFVPIDATRVQRATTELRLKRKKKQSNENTLETFMRLRIT